jgi:hypothetical protein
MDDLDINDPAHLEFYRQQLLTKKEQHSEKFIEKLMTNAKNEFQASMTSADVSHKERLEQAQQKLTETSIILAHKYQPLIKEYVAQQEKELLNNKFAVIKASPTSLQDMAAKYRACYEAWIYAKDDVSVKVHRHKDLGSLDVIDAFTLTYFATLTNRRRTGDNLHQLVVSGDTSCGKTLMFESPLLDIAHMLTTEKGVSRFNCDSKSTLLLHDVNLEILVKSDSDKLKAIARAEPVPTKTFGNVQTVPAVFMFVTSNRTLLNHVFDKPERRGFRFNRVYKTDLKPTRFIHEKDIAAVQSRFIEAFVRQRPVLPEGCLPKNENFDRYHVIVGLFDLVIDILSKLDKSNFEHQYLYLYALSGLTKHVYLLPKDEQELKKCVLYALMQKYELDETQIKLCCESMNFTPLKNEPEFDFV